MSYCATSGSLVRALATCKTIASVRLESLDVSCHVISCHLRISDESSCDSHPLLLPPAERSAPLPYKRVVPVRQLADETDREEKKKKTANTAVGQHTHNTHNEREHDENERPQPKQRESRSVHGARARERGPGEEGKAGRCENRQTRGKLIITNATMTSAIGQQEKVVTELG